MGSRGAALEGYEPANLTADERLTFSKIRATIHIALELRDEGIVGESGEPGGADLDLDDLHEPVWVP